LTKDELDEWMHQRGFRPLETLRSPKAPRRVSPEEFRCWHEQRAKVLTGVIADFLTGKITKDEGRRTLDETRKQLAEELWGRPEESTSPRDTPRVRDVNPGPGIGADNTTGEQAEGHRPKDGEATDY
jgi:hypothetical protein